MVSEMKSVEKCLDSQFWHAFAGGLIKLPPLNSKVYYFPQGHAEHTATATVDFGDSSRIPAYIPCRVSAINYMADPDTDEVYAKIGLTPLTTDTDFDFDDDEILGFNQNKNETLENSKSFAKTLTQSDANNGGGFSVPRYCADTIFPQLDYTADPPLQTIVAKDVHGESWKFRHIYRGTPRRHLLTTGWSTFVNKKMLVAGDSIVFSRADNGDLCFGIRRAKRGFRKEFSSDSVVEAARLAANGQQFEVMYYPRASTPEFCVRVSTVMAAMRVQWCAGMRFKMALETEDSSRISWFTGTVSAVHVADHIRWPDSPWKVLQVRWDEPDLLEIVKQVSPWQVEMVSNMPAIHLSPPRKKLRLTTTVPASIQGARHNNPQFNKIHSFPFGILNVDPLTALPPTILETAKETSGNVNKTDVDEKDKKKQVFMLFGQPILTEEQLSESSADDGSVVLHNGPVESSSEEAGPWLNEAKSGSGLKSQGKSLF